MVTRMGNAAMDFSEAGFVKFRGILGDLRCEYSSYYQSVPKESVFLAASFLCNPAYFDSLILPEETFSGSKIGLAAA